MITAIYAIALVFSIVALIILLEKRNVYDIYHVMLAVTIVFCNLGYLMLSTSKTLEEAILAAKISYLGCFLPFFMFMVISKLCKIRLHKWLKLSMAFFAILVYACVLTIGYSDIYYKTVELSTVNNTTTLLRTYGFAHTFYSVMIYGYMVATIVIILLSFKKKKTVSHTTVSWLGVMTVSSGVAFVLQKALPYKIELMPIIYGIISFFLIYWLGKTDMYDISVSLIRANERNNRVGYLVFKKNRQYCEASENVKVIFPEIADLEIDRIIPVSQSVFYTTIVTWLYDNMERDDSPSKIVAVNDGYYNVCMKKIRYGSRNKVIGYLIEFTDITSEQKYLRLINDYNEQLEREVRAKTENILEIQGKIILGTATIIESRDSSTGDHIKRTHGVVSVFAEKLCEMGIESREFLDEVIKAAPMHDIGKIAVDDRILRKKGKYTPDEYKEMQKHSAAGADIIKKILIGVESPDFVKVAVNVANYHHEKWDGSGYPEHLKENNIPVEARIMALADVFDALVSKRCYKEALSYEQAFSIIRDSLGKHFDPYLGSIFIGCKDKLVEYYDQLADATSDHQSICL